MTFVQFGQHKVFYFLLFLGVLFINWCFAAGLSIIDEFPILRGLDTMLLERVLVVMHLVFTLGLIYSPFPKRKKIASIKIVYTLYIIMVLYGFQLFAWIFGPIALGMAFYLVHLVNIAENPATKKGWITAVLGALPVLIFIIGMVMIGIREGAGVKVNL